MLACTYSVLNETSLSVLQAFTAQRWKLCDKECSNGLALGDCHLEIAHGLAQRSEVFESQEVGVFENIAVWNVNAGPLQVTTLQFGYRQATASA